jgi:DNA-binding XRE family transcriptional regulator
MHKLTDSQVEEIIELIASRRHSQNELAKMFGVCQQTIHAIKSGKLWPHIFHGQRDDVAAIPKRYHSGEKVGTSVLTESQVIEILKLIQERRMCQSDIAKRFGVSKSAIMLISTGRNWRRVRDKFLAESIAAGV